MIYAQSTMDFIWAEAKAAELCGDNQIASHLRAAALAMEIKNHTQCATPGVKAKWRVDAQRKKSADEVTLEDLGL